ncbi:DUF6273 domain-containing protein, partial [Lactococcus ileimucosae]|uniref:DUF6273 domain-containing protein n=1 Tax=Lactococcus ileimucosae TaxID=2941329 RepID=UPI0035118077
DSEQASSYLLDAAEMTAAIEDKVFNGFYYYGIHVESGLVHPDQHEEFLNDGEQHHPELEEFLRGIRNGVMFDDGQNPLPNEDSQPDAFDFSTMRPGRIFTMAGEQYRYLENMGSGNHMIIRNDSIRSRSWNQLDETLSTWYGQLDSAVQAMVQPVANNFTTGEVAGDSVTFTGGHGWIPNNLGGDVAADITQVVPGGTARAFALSLADVTRLSGGGLAFPNRTQRGRSGGLLGWWWLRTPAPGTNAWLVNPYGTLHAGHARTYSHTYGGVRPALILHQ